MDQWAHHLRYDVMVRYGQGWVLGGQLCHGDREPVLSAGGGTFAVLEYDVQYDVVVLRVAVMAVLTPAGAGAVHFHVALHRRSAAKLD